MSLKTQAKVLRVLQEQVTEPVGSTSRVQVDVRVLAATNKDLLAEIRAGRFREDLYFRLNVIPIFVPPLRDRAEDIPLLVEHFIADFALEYGRRAKTLTPGAMARAARCIAGPATCASCAMSSSGSSSWRRATRSAIAISRSCRATRSAEQPVDRTRRQRAGRAALHRARSVRARVHPAGARASAGQHFADGGSAGRRAQQPVQKDARVRHRAAARRTAPRTAAR